MLRLFIIGGVILPSFVRDIQVSNTFAAYIQLLPIQILPLLVKIFYMDDIYRNRTH